MRIDPRTLQALLPAAIAWARACSQQGLQTGRTLDPEQRELARSVGVTQPDHIRIVTSTNVPSPEDPQLKAVATAAGLMGDSVLGMTLGYAVFIRAGAESTRLLSHEFRHVHQFERAGSLEDFLTQYLGQIALLGYGDAPMERDARAHER